MNASFLLILSLDGCSLKNTENGAIPNIMFSYNKVTNAHIITKDVGQIKDTGPR